MTSFEKVRATGFHAELIERTIVRLNGGDVPTHMLYHLETTFDDDSVFRHLDYLGLSEGRLIVFHLDEVSGGVRWACNPIPLRSVDSVEVAQMLGDEGEVENGATHLGPHLLVQVLFSTHSSIELERIECGDPSCEYDHGYGGFMKSEGLAMRFFDEDTSGLASNADEAMDFVGALTMAMARA